jgi:hypothetical protein
VEDSLERGKRLRRFTTDASGLAGIRLTLAGSDEHIVLPESTPKSRLARSSARVTTSGQHREVGAFRTDQRRGVGLHPGQCRGDETTGNQDVKRILGVDGTFGEALGWAMTGPPTSSRRSAIRRGFERNVGAARH